MATPCPDTNLFRSIRTFSVLMFTIWSPRIVILSLKNLHFLLRIFSRIFH